MLAPKSKADGVPKYSRSPQHSPANAVIVHDSIHDPQRPGWAARKGVEKFFRMGRNAAYRLATGKSYDERRKR
jgi:hypothetical protein